MFCEGEYVVYGDLGVCRVEGVTQRRFEGLDAPHLYYVLAPVYQDGVLYVPADNPRIALRAVITAEEANRLIDAIPSMVGMASISRLASSALMTARRKMRGLSAGIYSTPP